jgi:hypothetical protein
MPVLTIGRQVDGIALLFQRRLELRAEGRFIFDNQNAHNPPFSCISLKPVVRF